MRGGTLGVHLEFAAKDSYPLAPKTEACNRMHPDDTALDFTAFIGPLVQQGMLALLGLIPGAEGGGGQLLLEAEERALVTALVGVLGKRAGPEGRSQRPSEETLAPA